MAMYKSNAPVAHDLLDMAGSMLEHLDIQDLSAPDLIDLTSVSQHGMATPSGLHDFDYQNLSNLALGQKQLQQIQTVNKVPIPAEILDHFKHIKCHCMMGLFPEIGRAWLSIDSEIYIWTYEQVRDVAYYDGLNQLILSVGLVKPKPKVFVDDVKYLLVLTTPAEITILGVTFNDTTKTISSPTRNMQSTTTFQEMQLMNKAIFIINTDNVPITVIKGTDDGRIFLGGRDGCLYEISYQAESSWFGRRCKKLNHSQGIVSYMMPSIFKVFTEIDAIIDIVFDNERQLLYVLTEKGAIEAWSMCNNRMQRLARIGANDIANNATAIVRTLDSSIFKMVKSICPILHQTCKQLNLLAVTQTGVRLYFSINPSVSSTQNGMTYGQFEGDGELRSPTPTSQLPTSTKLIPSQDRRGLYLVHVRLPPGYTPNSTTTKPKEVHLALFSDSSLLLISNWQQDQDLLWSISSAPFLNRNVLTESTTVETLDGVVWSIGEVADRSKAKLRSILRNARKPKRVVMLSNNGAHIISLLKPVDILQQLLVACNGPHNEAVKAYFQAQTEREACYTCLLLACGEQYRNTDVAMWAAQAFMLYGGEPKYQRQTMPNTPYSAQMQMNLSQQPAMGRPSLNASMMSVAPSPLERNPNQMFASTPLPTTMQRMNPCGRMNPQLQMTQAQQTQMPLSPIAQTSFTNTYGQYNELANLQYSAKHDGLYLYMARLLRPIWKMRCMDDKWHSTLDSYDCALILADLYAIRKFLEENSVNELTTSARSFQNPNTLNGYSYAQSRESGGLNEQTDAIDQAQAEEKRSLTALNNFIKHTCEIIGLWQVLCDHQLHLLVREMPPEQQKILVPCTFRDLVLARYDACNSFIVALINSYFKDNASVCPISATLREVCPNLFRQELAVSYRATEMIVAAKNCKNQDERLQKLSTALLLCKDAAPHLPLDRICQQFTFAGYSEGVIELVSTCAAKVDPEEIGIHYYNNEEPAEDREGFNAYAARMVCYKEVRLMLDNVYQTICDSNDNQDFSRTFCATPNNNEPISPNAEIMKIVILAVRIKDPLLHIAVYEWLLSHNMLSELLALAEPSLGEFLRRNALRSPKNVQLIDLLWKYYEKNGHHSQAAKILENLASTQSNAITLEQRIEYLARAVMCMRNDAVGYSVSNGVLLKELEDKLEIARVQKNVLDAITALEPGNENAANAKEELNNVLYNISQLYELFAEPFELWECMLVILNCSHHNDPLLIESVWGKIINKAVEGGTGRSLQERSTQLFTKMEGLVRQFSESGHCFPLAFIIRELEIKACRLRMAEGIVPEKLAAMGLDIELLMEYYCRMISMNERVWANEGNEWHLVQSSIRLVSLLADNANTIYYRSKRRIVGKAQDMVSVCLNLCYQKPGTEQLQKALKELQHRLQRIMN